MTAETASKRWTVALAGNPNAGKTSLYNALTGTRGKVGNYPGVTVERRSASITRQGHEYEILDLPGTYSLVARSPDEEIAHDALTGRHGDAPDVIVAVLDATNLARQLYLALQLIELERPIVVALNMMDLAETRGLEIDAAALSNALGQVPVVPIVAVQGTGLDDLLDAARRARKSTSLTPLSSADADAVEALRRAIAESRASASAGEAMWLLASTPDVAVREPTAIQEALKTARQATTAASDPARPTDFKRRLIAARYAVIDRIVGAAVTQTVAPGPEQSERVDAVLTHPTFGLLIFGAMMFVLFQAVYAWADPLIGLVEDGIGGVADWIGPSLPDGPIRDLVVDGLIAGVGAVLVFLPQIVILFFAISLLEATGYMARVAFLLDRLMRSVGLSGQSFVPLMSSFACAIPGVMAARTIPSRRDRLVTIAIAPLMSCSARLPVYTLVIGAVFSTAEPVMGVFSVAGLVITSMYFLGILSALFVAWLLKGRIVRRAAPPLLVELPPYRLPRLRDIAQRLYDRSRVFVLETGRVILVLSIVLWAAMTWPKTSLDDATADSIAASATTAGADAEAAVARAEESAQLVGSLAGRAGKLIEPVIEPLGFDWKIGIGLIGSFAAREVLVSTLGQVYGTGGDVDEETPMLREALLAETNPETGKPRFSPLVGLSLMVFFAIAMQCLSTLAVVRRETNSWTWPIGMLVGYNALAWVASFTTYQVGLLLGFG